MKYVNQVIAKREPRPLPYWERLREPKPAEVKGIPGNMPVCTRVRVMLLK